MKQGAVSGPQKQGKLFSQAGRYQETSDVPWEDSHTHRNPCSSRSILRELQRQVYLQWTGLCCQSNTALPRSAPHWGQTGENSMGKSTYPTLPAGKRQGGLAAPQAAGLRTGWKRLWLGEFSEPWTNGSLNQANRMLSILKIRAEATGTCFRAH